MSDKLRCNFCSENEAIPDIGLFGLYHVVCPICGVQGPPCDTEIEAVEAWNKCGEKTRAAYINLARLIVDWYTAPEDSGFSEETLALQNEAKRLSETPEIGWLP